MPLKVTFVALGWEQMGVSLLSSIAKRDGHQVSLAFNPALFNDRYNLSIPHISPLFDETKEILKLIQKQNPDVLAFSTLTGTYQWMLNVAKKAKEFNPNIKTIFGGVHVSAVPQRVLAQPQVDYVCVGEGDIAFPLILKAIECGQTKEPIPNTHFKYFDGSIIRGPQTGFIQDLDSLPIFDKTIWEEHIRVGDVYFTMASRGCPYRCTFCFNNFFANLPEEKKGKYVRQRSVNHMMHELRIAKKRYKLKIIDFEDDVFTVDKKWVHDFLYQYKKEINVPFQCLTHPKYMDEDVTRWLAEAGCHYIQMGIQSMDDDYKFQTIKRYEKTAHVEQALALMKKYKIGIKVDHMFGLLGEPIEAQEKAREVYIKYPPYRIQTFWTNFLPGTEMVYQGLEMGVINKEDVERLNDGLGFDFYRKTNKIEDPLKLKTYKSYETLFKLISILPQSWLTNLNPKFFIKLPNWFCATITFIIDAFWGLGTRNPDHIGYAKHYLFHLYRLFSKKVGLKTKPATQILNAETFNLKPTNKNKEESLLKV